MLPIGEINKKGLKVFKINAKKSESSQISSNGRKTAQNNQINQYNSRTGYNSQMSKNNNYNFSENNSLNGSNKLSEISSARTKYQSPYDPKNKTNNKREPRIKPIGPTTLPNSIEKNRIKNIILSSSKLNKETSEEKSFFNEKFTKYENKNKNKSKINDNRNKYQLSTSFQSDSQNPKDQSIFRYQSKYNQNQPSSLQNNNIFSKYLNTSRGTRSQYTSEQNSRQNIYFEGSSQSNTLNTYGRNGRSGNNDIKKEDPKITITSYKSNLVNKKQLNNKNLRANNALQKDQPIKSITTQRNNQQSFSMPKNSNTSRENTVFHSIVELRKSPKQSYILNVRKTDIIKNRKRYRKSYYYSKKDDNKPFVSSENHKIFERRNVTKERKTVADLPEGIKILHRYSYNYNPNISNKSVHSIDETSKTPKKEYVLTPRKNNVIQSERHFKKTYNASQSFI